MAAKTKKVSAKERIQKAQAEAAAKTAEAQASGEKPKRTRKAKTLADLKAEIEKIKAREANLTAMIFEKEHPQLAELSQKLREAQAEVGMASRKVKQRWNRIRTAEEKLSELRASVPGLERDEHEAKARVARLQTELDKARAGLEEGSDEPASEG